MKFICGFSCVYTHGNPYVYKCENPYVYTHEIYMYIHMKFMCIWKPS